MLEKIQIAMMTNDRQEVSAPLIYRHGEMYVRVPSVTDEFWRPGQIRPVAEMEAHAFIDSLKASFGQGA